jgi:hypothetical protein
MTCRPRWHVTLETNPRTLFPDMPFNVCLLSISRVSIQDAMMILGAFCPVGSRYRPRTCHCCFPGIWLVSPLCSASLLVMVNIVLAFLRVIAGRCFRHCRSSTQSGSRARLSPETHTSKPCGKFAVLPFLWYLLSKWCCLLILVLRILPRNFKLAFPLIREEFHWCAMFSRLAKLSCISLKQEALPD